MLRLVSKGIVGTVTDIFPRVTKKQPLEPLEPHRSRRCQAWAANRMAARISLAQSERRV
jgi:hypothetical protein